MNNTQSEESLSGIIEHVTFHNKENGFCVFKVHVSGRRELVTVVGSMPVAATGEYIQCRGQWQNNRDHGMQFAARFLKVLPPHTKEGMEKYLASGQIKGIGAHFAAKLVAVFGEAVFDVIEKRPERLTDVTGIGPSRARKIRDSWASQKNIREIMVFLQSHGVSLTRATRIYRTYGDRAIEMVSENPYRLARDIRGVGFLTADTIARYVGIPKHSVLRAQAGFTHVLLEACGEGHCGLPEDVLLEKTKTLLGIDMDTLRQGLTAEIAEGHLLRDSMGGAPAVFLEAYYQYERGVARMLLHLREGMAPCGDIPAQKAMAWVEKSLEVTLATRQKEAVMTAIASKMVVITGGPGTGKTTLLRALLTILDARHMVVSLCAPTGRAAKRLTESTGFEAKTLHRLLEMNPAYGGFKRHEDNLLDCDYVIIDESSMVDTALMYALLKALPGHAGLVLVGDVNQLSSVGAGQVLADIIASGKVPVITLTEIFRQAAGSAIVRNAHLVNKGDMPCMIPEEALTDFYFIDATLPEDVLEKVSYIVKERIPKTFGVDALRDIQVLCPLQRGQMGARVFNVALQKVLNPTYHTGVEKYGQYYAVGDKVMHVENDYDKDVYNGDIGFVTAIDKEEQDVHVAYDGRVIVYDFEDLDALVLAYATTIHKAQGSEYPVVVFPLTMHHYIMLKRTLLYTGITRGKRLVVLVGDKKALRLAVENKQGGMRYSKLNDWLCCESMMALTDGLS